MQRQKKKSSKQKGKVWGHHHVKKIHKICKRSVRAMDIHCPLLFTLRSRKSSEDSCIHPGVQKFARHAMWTPVEKILIVGNIIRATNEIA